MSQAPTLRQRLRYRFDTTMAHGVSALVGYLALATLALIGLFTLVVLLGHFAPESDSGDKPGLIRQAFNNLLHALDPGTVANDSGNWPFLLAMLLLTLGGLFVVSALIGVLANGLDARLQELRKGRSFVIEQDHTLILGWSDTIFTILGELAIANESVKDPVVVVLAGKDKVEMEDAIREKVGKSLDGTRVVCRSGHPMDLVDLRIANPQQARSIIVLAPEKEKNPDSQVIKVLLALLRGPLQRDGEAPYKIVAEIQDPTNMEAARLVGQDDAVLIDKSETISRLLAHSSRQSGISIVYTELLDFSGDEIYFRHDPALEGKSFGEALFAYSDCCVIGIASNGGVKLNPPADRVIGSGDEVIAIAEDDSRLNAATEDGATAAISEEAIAGEPRSAPKPQKALLLGWNHRGAQVIEELDGYVQAGSELLVVNELGEADAEINRLKPRLENLTVSFRRDDTTSRRVLEDLDPVGFDSAIVLCYSDHRDQQSADADTLVTLLHLRDIVDKADGYVSIVSEMLDDRNRELAEVTRVNDVIVSDKVISLMLAQLAENDKLRAVFDELFAVDGAEIYLRPVRHYVKPGSTVNFATIVEAAKRREEVAIGYRVNEHCDDGARDYGVRINPVKSEEYTVSPDDRVVVLAED